MNKLPYGIEAQDKTDRITIDRADFIVYLGCALVTGILLGIIGCSL